MVGSFKKRMSQWFAQTEGNVSIGFSKSFPVAIVLLDDDLKIVNFTRQWKKDFQLSSIDDEDLVGRSIDDVLTAIPLYQPEWMRIIKNALKGEATFKKHDIYKYNESQFDWVNWSAKPWRTSGENIVGVILSSETITRQLELEQYYELSPNMLCTANVSGFFLDVNEVFTQVLGYSKEYLLERSFYDYIHPDDIEKTAQAIESLKEQDKIENLEIRFRRQDGSYIYLEWSAVKKHNSDVFYALANDASTGRSQNVIATRHGELINNLVNLQELFIRGVNIKQLFNTALKQFLDLTGSESGFIAAINTDENEKKYLVVLAISEMDWEEDTYKFYEQYSKGFIEIHDLDNVFGKTINSKDAIIENITEENDEVAFPVGFDCKSYLGVPMRSDDEVLGILVAMNNQEGYEAGVVDFINPFVRTVVSIIEAEGSVVDVSHVSRYDKLTSLYSRAFFIENLKDIYIEKSTDNSPFALIYVNLIRFKAINDTYGHLIGDELLEKVSKRLMGAVGDTDVLGRIAGDQFGIIVQDSDRIKDILRICKKFRNVLIRPYDIQDIKLEVEVYIGVSVFPKSGDTVEELEKHANFALYEAKKKADNVEVYSEAVEKIYKERLLIENNIDTAFSKNEFFLEYQPQVNVTESKLYGVEVLVRWRHPKLGILLPDKFIPIIEELGKVERLNLWVVEQISRDIQYFPEHLKQHILISFNFSPSVYNLQDHMKNLAEKFSDELKNYKLQAEITEKEIWDPKFSVVEFSNNLEELGITLSIDDFGKSYSSLHRLVELPIKTIKIDMGFVHNMLEDEKTEKVIISIINLAHSLDMEVIAEGVETKEQLNRLREHGCRFMQGNYFYKPMPIKVFNDIFGRKRK